MHNKNADEIFYQLAWNDWKLPSVGQLIISEILKVNNSTWKGTNTPVHLPESGENMDQRREMHFQTSGQ